MFSVHGQIINTFYIQASEKYPEPSYKVQLLGENIMKDGQCRKEMLDLSIPVEVYNSLIDRIGEQVQLPVGLFADKGTIRAFFPKGVNSNDLALADILE